MEKIEIVVLGDPWNEILVASLRLEGTREYFGERTT